MPTATYKRRSRHTPSGLELPRCDGRTLAARRYRALCVAFEQELGGDLGIVDQNLIRQAAGLVLASERFQDAAVSGAEINLDALVRVSSEARRILGMLRGKSDKRQAAFPTSTRSTNCRRFGLVCRLTRRNCSTSSRGPIWPR